MVSNAFLKLIKINTQLRLLDLTPSSRRPRAIISPVVVLFLLNPFWGLLSSGSNAGFNMFIIILLYYLMTWEIRLIPLYLFGLDKSPDLGAATMISAFHLSGMWPVVNAWLTKPSTMSSSPQYLWNSGVKPSSHRPSRNGLLFWLVGTLHRHLRNNTN